MRARTQVPRTLVHSSSGTAGPASTLTLNLPTHYVNRTADCGVRHTFDRTLNRRWRIAPRAALFRRLTPITPPGCIAPFVSATTRVWRSSYV